MKKQPELVSKWVLLDGADLPRTEAWLEKMAAQGLLFQSSSALRFGWWFFLPLVRFTFRRDTPRTGRRYRLCPTREPDTSPSGELLELYRHGGWQYTAALTADWGAFYIFYTDDPNAEEPYTDLDSFRLALRHPREGILALLALAAAGVLLRLTLASQRFSELSSSLTPDVSAIAVRLLLAALLLAVFGFLGLDYLSIRSLQRTGRDGNRPPLARRLFPLRAALSAVSILLSGLVLLTLILRIFTGGTRSDLPLSQWDPDFPLLTLAELDGGDRWLPQEDETLGDELPDGFLPEGASPPAPIVIRHNTVDIRQYDPLSPVRTCYRVNQAGSGGLGHGELDLDYYVAQTSRAAQDRLALLKEQIVEGGTSSHLPPTLVFQPEAVPGAGQFLTRRSGETWEIPAQKGRRFFYLAYDGPVDLTGWYDEIAAMLTPVNETA